MFKFDKRMASEVPNNELNALVTCEFFIFKRIFTLDVQQNQLTLKVSNKLVVTFSLIVCCKKLKFKGQI